MKRFIAMGLLWFCVFAILFQVLTGFFSKPKRAASVNNSDNPFTKNNGSSNNNGKISDPPIPVDPNLAILTGKLDHVLVEVQKCTGNGSQLIIEGTMTNQGADETLTFSAGIYGSTKMYDDYGNQFNQNYIQVANLSTDYKMNVNFIFGVPIKFIVKFNVPTVAGETQARTIKLFRLAVEGFQTDFKNIKVEKASKNLPAATPTPVATLTPSPTPAITPTPNATPSPTPAITPTPSATPSPTVTTTPTNTPKSNK